MQLNEEQRLAVTTVDRDLCLLAGAGTGKTRVLAERFLYLVRSGKAQADEILAITFTEKAAAEMLRRLGESFNSDRLKDNIGTIHSLCYHIVRSYHAECHLPIDAVVATEMTTSAVCYQALDETILQLQQSHRSELQTLLQTIPWHRSGSYRDRLHELLFPLYGNLRSSGWQAGQSLYVDVPDARLASEFEAVQKQLDALIALLDRPERSEAVKKQQQALPRFANLHELPALVQQLLQLKQELRGRWNKQTELSRDRLRKTTERLLTLLSQRLAKPTYEALARFLDRLDAIYWQRKQQRGLLDYDDLQLITLKLLKEHHKVRDKLRQRFRFILVDEFQDVSPVQRELVELLHSDGNLFFVGDVRQSIYAFRHADIHSFEMLRNKFAKATGSTLPLTENYRAHPELLDLLNDYVDVHDASLTEGCAHGPELRPALHFAKQHAPPIECRLVRGESAAAARAQEANQLAARIHEIVENREVCIANQESPRYQQHLGYGDIALLCRRSASIPLFRDALARLNIPTSSVAAGGFYGTREVQDTLTLLRLGVDPMDDLAMAAALKSDFVAISDAALYQLCRMRQEQGGTIWQYLLQVDGVLPEELVPEQDQQRLAVFFVWLQRIFQQRALSLVYPSMEALVLHSEIEAKFVHNYEPFVAEQKLANLDKLLGLALQWDSSGNQGVIPFVNMCEALQRRDVKEPQADPPFHRGSVRLMTVHAAKGLEFPLVVVADLRRSGGRAAPPIASDRDGKVGLRWYTPEFGALNTLGYQQIDTELRRRFQAEEQRIFYVALSRAQEHLILSSGVGGRLEASWLKLLLAQFPLAEYLDDEAARPVEQQEIRSFSGRSRLQLYLA